MAQHDGHGFCHAARGAAMAADKTWEDETLELIEDAMRERRKAELRRAAADRTIALQDERIAALRLALDTYRTKYGVPKTDPLRVESAVKAEFQGLTPKEMLRHWAQRHDGEVTMNDACKFLAAAGLFVDDRQAAGTLYSTIRRMPEFERKQRGVFRWQPTAVAAVNEPSVWAPPTPAQPRPSLHAVPRMSPSGPADPEAGYWEQVEQEADREAEMETEDAQAFETGPVSR